MKWIIIDIKRLAALYGFGGKTLTFSSKEIALEVGNQFFVNNEDFIIISINN